VSEAETAEAGSAELTQLPGDVARPAGALPVTGDRRQLDAIFAHHPMIQAQRDLPHGLTDQAGPARRRPAKVVRREALQAEQVAATGREAERGSCRISRTRFGVPTLTLSGHILLAGPDEQNPMIMGLLCAVCSPTIGV